jgi:tetratricopeptide (TPR) repeat protein
MILKNTVAWNNKGIDLGMLGKYDDAIKAFDRATTINSFSCPRLHQSH